MQGPYDDAVVKALNGAREELQSLAEFISQGLAAPVRTIQSLAASLIEDQEEYFDELGREQARLLVEEAARLAEFVRDLSEYSRVGRAAVELDPVSLDEIADEVLRRSRASIEANGASVSVERPLGRAMGDPSILFPVLSNLIEYAVKFIPPEAAPRVSIWTAPAAETNRVRLWVEHNGAGIEDRERIFHLFYRPNSAAAYPATGTGLAIVKKGMEKLGGTAGVEPAIHCGSRFWIELPAG